ncbi:MAG: ankyrin repeat domain-containing protein [Proteobacteria bacterium]|nr:ankyrin repeat domain-containing protein [Pseudomonadota bacterium]
MKLTFDEMKAQIVAGETIDAKKANFDINTVKSEVDYRFHDSEMFSNTFKITTEYTLLHCAIKSGHEQAVENLLENKASVNISYKVTEEREQTDNFDNSTGEVTNWPTEVSNTSCLELAKDKSTILALLKPKSPARSSVSTFGSTPTTSSSSSSSSSSHSFTT